MFEDLDRAGGGRAWRLACVLFALSLSAGSAWAAVGGSYDGSMTVRQPPASFAVAAALHLAGTALDGTVVLTSSDTGLAGTYVVTGKSWKTRIRLKGQNAIGATLSWGAKITPTGLVGRALLKNRYRRLSGVVSLTPAASAGDGSSCDAVFVANQALFVDQVLGQVLAPICANCHVAGGAAATARLRVTPGDALATARTVALMVDPVDPSSSRLLNKPTARVPHGGGPQILGGGVEEQILQHWVDLLAAARCVGAGPGYGDTGEAIYATACASCHGADARGSAGRPAILCARAVHDTVRNGSAGPLGVMPSFPDMTDAQIVLLQDYLDSLCPAATATGDDLFTGNCAPCHGGDAAGGAGRPDIRCAVPSWIGATVRAGRGPGHAVMPRFVSSELADAELAKIVAWLGGRCSGTPAGRFASNCASCHGATAGGGQNADGVRGPEIACQSTADFIEKVTQGSDAMPRFAELAPAHVNSIADWVHGSFCHED